MSWLIFTCGAGCGALVATLVMLVILGLAMRIAKPNAARVDEYNKLTIGLLRERNEIDEANGIRLARIAQALEARS
jgi:hypothetical protein